MIRLPDFVLHCIRALEQAGYQAYCVGGCVRDCLLGLEPQDYDLCTNALPEQTREVFSSSRLVRSGEKHGTIGVVTPGGVVEITTFRTEGGYKDSRHPDWVRFVPRVEEDLARRDFTVNAMAYNPTTGLHDPWGGQADLAAKILRTVGNPTARFTEDALRILRGVRFAVRYDLTPDPETLQAMFALSSHMEFLAKERIFDELCKLLPLVTVRDLQQFSPVLAYAVPGLGDTVGFLQHSPHHAYDVFTHICHVVENTPPQLDLRWAALLHDIGKPAAFTMDENGRGHFKGHAAISAQKADAILQSLHAPTALREKVIFLVSHHMTPMEPDRRLLRRRLSRYGVETTLDLLTLQQSDMGGKGTGKREHEQRFALIRQLIDELLDEDACLQIKDLTINGSQLLAIGLPAGPVVGACLQHLLDMVLDEQLPNDPSALLDAAKQYIKENVL